MAGISTEEMNKIKRAVEKEFPHDMALQQIHIARKIIAHEAKQKGLSYYEYLRSFDKDRKSRKST